MSSAAALGRFAGCVGVDGARASWIAVWCEAAGLGFKVYDQVDRLLAAHADAHVIAVDVPIGLSECGPRQAEPLARAFVGGRRACSIFATPVRGILGATSQPEASDQHRAIDGRGYGAQAFALLPKIRAWDGVLRHGAQARVAVREVHPEVSFAAMRGGKGVVESKKSPAGAQLRTALLGQVFGLQAVEALLSAVPRRAAAPDDVLDALAALWTAGRIAAGQAQSLPDPVPHDRHGLPMAIWY